MSWAVGWDEHWQRDIGYGVPAFCDRPNCNAEIDRGLSYVCGGEPWGGDHGCGLYFCEKHLAGEHHLCSACRQRHRPFEPKPEHPVWLKHKNTHPSWASWRELQHAR